MNVDYFVEITKEVSILYEISLAIGSSLDLKTNCEHFLKTLMAKKGLTYAAVWLKDRYLCSEADSDRASLVFAHPEFYVREKALPLSHPLFLEVQNKPCFTCSSDDVGFQTSVTEKCVTEGTLAIFSLGEIGFLKLLSVTRKKPFEQKQINQLRSVLAKFAVSLEGCLAYEHSLREVEERKKAEQLLQAAQTMLEERVEARTAELNESRGHLSSILNTIGDAIVVSGLDGEVQSCNRAFLELFGCDMDEVRGRSWLEFFPPHKRDEVVSGLQSLGEKGNFHFESESVRREDAPFPVEVTVSRMKNSAHLTRSAVVLIKDITERKALEQELRKAHKLESLGVLAGGIAHDFNNLLAGIVGNTSLIKYVTRQEDVNYRRLESIEKAAERARDLTQQLLTFSRGGKPVRKTMAVEQTVMDSASLVLRGSNIKCEFHIPDFVWPVDADEGQITQVFNNLIINADQAMPDGGVITIHIENVSHAPKDFQAPQDRKYVKISLRDQGVGIPEENLSRIFDPYFTTKKTGSGLGLAIVYSIIRNHNGHIRAESGIGNGTTFHVYLPASDAAVPTGRQKANGSFAGAGRLLVMDDEPIIREVASEILGHLGYDVVTCCDGTEAVELYSEALERREPFVAVILDLTIPGGMGGKEAMKKLRELDPKVVSIVSSGYCNDPILAHYEEYGFSGVVEKPYSIDTLGSTLRKLLGTPCLH